ncbi:MAG: dienelactone hydrolase family protein [Actinomycetota bacterium]|nr:dienelactone hydrolase family protein [Actinomycetota bacterium]
MESDELLVADGDLDVARELDETIESAQLFLYPGNRHLFVDSSLADFNEGAATLLTERVLAFLDRIE